MALRIRSGWVVGIFASAWLAACGDDGGDDELERDASASTAGDGGALDGSALDGSALDGSNTPSMSADATLDGAPSASDGSTPDATLGQPDASPDGSTTASVTFSTVYGILKANCTGCHAPRTNPTRAPSGGLDLSTQAIAYAELVTMPNAEGPDCGGSNRKRVIAKDADGSLLVQKLKPNPACGNRMPRNADPLSSEQIAQISSWITAGALNN